MRAKDRKGSGTRKEEGTEEPGDNKGGEHKGNGACRPTEAPPDCLWQHRALQVVL